MQNDTPSPNDRGAGITVHVDHDVCSGTAHCQQSMPDVFTVVNRKSHVRPDVDWATVDRDELDRAVEGCPWFAISVTDSTAQSAPSEGD